MIPADPRDRHELRGGTPRGALLVWRGVRAARRLPLLAPLLLASACTTATLATIPEPLPEALPWSVPAQGGAFLGLSVEENDSGSLDNLYFQPGVRVITVAPS